MPGNLGRSPDPAWAVGTHLCPKTLGMEPSFMSEVRLTCFLVYTGHSLLPFLHLLAPCAVLTPTLGPVHLSVCLFRGPVWRRCLRTSPQALGGRTAWLFPASASPSTSSLLGHSAPLSGQLLHSLMSPPGQWGQRAGTRGGT